MLLEARLKSRMKRKAAEVPEALEASVSGQVKELDLARQGMQNFCVKRWDAKTEYTIILDAANNHHVFFFLCNALSMFFSVSPVLYYPYLSTPFIPAVDFLATHPSERGVSRQHRE